MREALFRALESITEFRLRIQRHFHRASERVLRTPAHQSQFAPYGLTLTRRCQNAPSGRAASMPAHPAPSRSDWVHMPAHIPYAP